MMNKLDNYETVKERKKRFYTDHKDGRIVVSHVEITDKAATMKCTVYKNKDDQKNGLCVSTGYAQEFKGQGGFANKFAWLENCEESAVGRALDNAGYSGNNKCSQEEMKKVENAKAQANPKVKKQSKPFNVMNLCVNGWTANDLKELLPKLVNVKTSRQLTQEMFDMCLDYVKENSPEKFKKEQENA